MKKTYNQPNVEITTFTAEPITSDDPSGKLSTNIYLDDWES